MIDRLLRCNGYDNPRQYIDYRDKGRGVNKAGLSKSVVLKLPYISESVSNEIRKFIRNRNLPVNVIFSDIFIGESSRTVCMIVLVNI